MMMAGLYFTGEVPFKDVYVHALIRDAHGQKMSKSKGNVIDPLDVLVWSGTDALRFTLASLAVPGRDVILSEDRIEGYRHFVNKLWNASRFVLMNLEGYEADLIPDEGSLTVADRWIISRLNKTIKKVETNLERYNFSEACNNMYTFVWNEYCDWYIEITKDRLYGSDATDRETARYILVTVLDNVLRMLHPVMPFVTEEIWQKLPAAGETIMRAQWPQIDPKTNDPVAEEEITFVIELVNSIRQAKHESGVTSKQSVELTLFCDEPKYVAYVDNNASTVLRLSKINCERIGTKPSSDLAVWQTNVEHSRAIKLVIPRVEGFIEVSAGGAVDTKDQIERIAARLKSVAADLEKLQIKLDNEQFVSKASSEAVEKVRDKAKDLQDVKEKLEHQLNLLRG